MGRGAGIPGIGRGVDQFARGRARGQGRGQAQVGRGQQGQVRGGVAPQAVRGRELGARGPAYAPHGQAQEYRQVHQRLPEAPQEPQRGAYADAGEIYMIVGANPKAARKDAAELEKQKKANEKAEKKNTIHDLRQSQNNLPRSLVQNTIPSNSIVGVTVNMEREPFSYVPVVRAINKTAFTGRQLQCPESVRQLRHFSFNAVHDNGEATRVDIAVNQRILEDLTPKDKFVVYHPGVHWGLDDGVQHKLYLCERKDGVRFLLPSIGIIKVDAGKADKEFPPLDLIERKNTLEKTLKITRQPNVLQLPANLLLPEIPEAAAAAPANAQGVPPVRITLDNVQHGRVMRARVNYESAVVFEDGRNVPLPVDSEITVTGVIKDRENNSVYVVYEDDVLDGAGPVFGSDVKFNTASKRVNQLFANDHCFYPANEMVVPTFFTAVLIDNVQYEGVPPYQNITIQDDFVCFGRYQNEGQSYYLVVNQSEEGLFMLLPATHVFITDTPRNDVQIDYQNLGRYMQQNMNLAAFLNSHDLSLRFTMADLQNVPQ